MAAVRHQFCRDTINTFGHDDQNFHCSREYSYYSSPSTQEKKRRWSLGAPRDIFQAKEFQGNLACSENMPSCIDGWRRGWFHGFKPEEDDLIGNDTTMDDWNVETIPTPAPKLKSTIMDGTSRLSDGGPDKTKRSFRKETGGKRNSHFAVRK